MLILSRKIGEQLVVGEDTHIHILAVKGKQIRIGVEAPRTVSVHRQEIFELIKQQPLESQQLTATLSTISGQRLGRRN